MVRTPSTPVSPSALISALELDDPEERAIASGVSWKAYETLLVQLEDNSHYRVSYLFTDARSDGYELVDRSEVLSDLDIVCLTECIQISDPMEALDRLEAELDRPSKLK